MPADDEGHLAAPGIHKAGPASVEGDVFAIAGAEADGGMVEGLPHVLQDCEGGRGREAGWGGRASRNA